MRGLKRAYMTTSGTTPSQRNESNRGQSSNIQRPSKGGMSNTSKAALGAGALGLGIGGVLGYSKQNRTSKSMINKLKEDKQGLANDLMDLKKKTNKGPVSENVGSFMHKVKSMWGGEDY